MLPFVIFTGLCVAGLLAAEWHGSRVGVWIAKPLASSGFVAAAIAVGALDSTYGAWLLTGLLLSWLGDVLLIPKQSPRILQAGILSFLSGHIAFALAFTHLGTSAVSAALGALVTLVPAILVVRWLAGHVEATMRPAVFTYVAVIAVMLVCAAGALGRDAPASLLIGVSMFAVSDVSVARDRFVAPGFVNGAWGLPLYYAAQLVLASSVA